MNQSARTANVSLEEALSEGPPPSGNLAVPQTSSPVGWCSMSQTTVASSAPWGQVTSEDARMVLEMHNYACLVDERADSYLDSGETRLYRGLREKFGISFRHYHRTMEDHMAAFSGEGFLLRSLVVNPAGGRFPSTFVLELVRR